MAIKIPVKGETFEVVTSIDDALDMNDEEFTAYRETYNPELLKLKPGVLPTIFVMRKVIPYDLKNAITSAQRKVVAGEVQFDFGSTTMEVKAALMDIKNGGEFLKMKRDGDGSASKDVMEGLMAAGIVDELWAAIKTVVKDTASSIRKK